MLLHFHVVVIEVGDFTHHAIDLVLEVEGWG
jgi:hypothetical protein